ncbi:MAG: aspartyl protease family protein [Chromatiaceae bacterium]|nr:aspartyl protease family protein [Chromatiaceae bacterium]
MKSESIRQSNDRADVSEALADEDFIEGRFVAATRAYEALLDRYPGRLDIAARLGYLDLLANRPDSAVARLSNVLENGLRTRSILSHLAEAYSRRGDLGHAALCYEQLGRGGLAGTLAVMAGLKVFRVEKESDSVCLDLLSVEPLPVMRALVNGVGANLVIDTGAGDCVLDMRFAVSAGVRLGGQEWRDFAGGHRAQVTHAHLEKLGMDTVSIHDLPVQVLDLQSTFGGWFPGQAIHGIVGISVLSLFDCTLDYQTGHLVLQPSVTANPKPGCTPIWLAENRMLLTHVDFPLLQEALVFIDTGMTGRMFAAPETRRAGLGIEPDRDQTLVGTGGAGDVHGRGAYASRLRLAGKEQTMALGLLLPSLSIETALGYRINGLIGHDLLRGARLNLNFTRMQLCIA